MSVFCPKNGFILLLLIFISCGSKLNQEVINLEGEQILVGKIDWSGLSLDPYSDWFTPNYLNYSVDSESLVPIKDKLEATEVIVFMGTWCEDSQIEVPQFFKILDHLAYNISDMSVIALERLESGKLVSPQQEESGFEISHVPTFIFLQRGKEIGRISEYPIKTLEKDMVMIIAQTE
jgi:thiol-disulfide isomerase/thioredoxin